MTSATRLDAVRRILRAMPDKLPGKARLTSLLIRGLDGDQAVCLPDRFGNRIWCPSLKEPIAAALLGGGAYEPDTIAMIVSRLPARGVFLDVGANIGAVSTAVAAQRREATVVCVEADPRIADWLSRNLQDNGYSGTRLVQCLAGAETRDRVPFYRAPDTHFGMGSIGPQFGEPGLDLPQRRLDDVLDELAIPAVDVVKLDIEGAELGALQGLRRRLAGPRAPVLVFEFNDWAERRIPGQSPGDAQVLLLSLGYRLSLLGPKGALGRPLAEPMIKGAAMIVATPSRSHSPSGDR